MAGKRKNNSRTAGETPASAAIPAVTPKAEADDAPWESDGLTIRQRRFVEALTGPAAGNATKAAEMAGYNANNRNSLAVTAHDLLRKPNVQQAIARAYTKKNQTPEWVRDRLFELANASITPFLGENGLDFQKAAAAGALGAVREYTEEAVGEAVVRRKVKLHDPVRALETIARLMGLIVEKHEHTGRDGKPIETRTVFDLSKLPTEELQTLRALALKARGGKQSGGQNG